jgi:hypothetical protein
MNNNYCPAIEDLSGYVSMAGMGIIEWESIMNMGSGLNTDEKEEHLIAEIDFIQPVVTEEIDSYSPEDLRMLKIWKNGSHRCLSSHHYDAAIEFNEDGIIDLGTDNELWVGEFFNYEINRKTIFKITRLSGKECIYYVKIRKDIPFGVPV